MKPKDLPPTCIRCGGPIESPPANWDGKEPLVHLIKLACERVRERISCRRVVKVATRKDLAGLIAAPFWGILWFFTLGRMGKRPPLDRWREAWVKATPTFRHHRQTSGGGQVPSSPWPRPAEVGSVILETGVMHASLNEHGVPARALVDGPTPTGDTPEDNIRKMIIAGKTAPGDVLVGKGRVVARRKIRDAAAEDNNFFRAYAAIESMTLEQVRGNLLKLGRWPAERIIVRVLDWEEAVERLTNDTQACLAMVRAVVAIEDPDKKLYLVKTPELATGLRTYTLKAMDEVEMEAAVRQGYKIH